MANILAKKERFPILRGILVPVLIFSLLFVLLNLGLSSLSNTTAQEGLRATEQSIRQAIALCYAVEGSYPPSLTYLTEHYGVQIDQKYIVHYAPFASNIMPDVIVMEKGSK